MFKGVIYIKKELLLKGCNLNKCEAMCCYDGVHLAEEEVINIKEIVSKFPKYFSHLPEKFIVKSTWKGLEGTSKTAVRHHDFKNKNFPKHFSRTKCVFNTDDNLCSLQVASANESSHEWDFKPMACWKFPLGKDLKPIAFKNDKDPDYIDENYPGYVTYTKCGSHCEDGTHWEESLNRELNYKKNKKEYT